MAEIYWSEKVLIWCEHVTDLCLVLIFFLLWSRIYEIKKLLKGQNHESAKFKEASMGQNTKISKSPQVYPLIA